MSPLVTVLTVIGTVLVAVIGVVGARITAKGAAHASPYDALADRVLKLEQQHDEDEKQREADRTEIAGLKRRLSVVIDDRDALVRYFTRLRDWVAQGSPPPAPPVPTHLRDVIPDWTPADDERG